MARSVRDFMPKEPKVRKVAKAKPVSSGVNKRAEAKAVAAAKSPAMSKKGFGMANSMNKKMALEAKKSGYKRNGRPAPKKKTTKKFVVDPRYTAGF